MREKEPHTTLLFVRHGQPDYPEDRIYARADDPGLTHVGLAQAEALGGWIKGNPVDAVYVSPTRRTLETVAPMSAILGREAVTDERLEERHFGIWEGLFFDEIRDDHPDDFLSWKTDPIGFAPQGGETVADLEKRMSAAVTDMHETHRGGTVLVVCHVGTIRTALCGALKVPLAEYRRFHVATGSVARVDYGRRQANLIYLGFLPGGGDAWKGGDA